MRKAKDSRFQQFSSALAELALNRTFGGRKIEPFLRHATEVVARTASVGRASVWLFTKEGRAIRCVDLYSGETRHSRGSELSMSDFPAYFASLRRRRAIAAHDAHRDARTREFSKSYLTPLGITSMLDAPIRVGGKMIGLLCLEHVGQRRRWSTQEQSFAASAADLIALSFENAERQRAVEELRQSEDLYRALAENFPHGAVLLFDRDLRYVVAHGLSVASAGLKVESLVGHTIFEVLPPDTCEALEPHYRAALAGKMTVFEIPFGGRVFEVHTLPVRFSGGRVTLAMSVAHDITVRLEAEAEIRKNHRLLNDAQAMAKLGVFEWQAEKNRLSWSDSLRVIFGVADDAPATFDSFLMRVHPEDRERVRERIYEAYTNGSSFAQEERIVRSDGNVRVLASKGEAVRDASGKVTGLIGVCQDVTELKEAHRILEEYSHMLEREVADRTRELREKQAELVQSAKMASLGNLVAEIAHEMNSPLGAMIANCDIVHGSALQLRDLIASGSSQSARAADLIDILLSADEITREAGRRIDGIVSGLRRFARLDQAQEDDADIHDLLENTLPLIRHLLQDRIVVQRDYGKLPHVRCYPNKLNQVWMNLLVNATQSIEGQGKIRIRTFTDGARAVVEIADTGRGIPPENRNRIFDPGFTTKGVRVGTGLGLAIVHRIIEEHQGSIEVESEPGRGATFRVFLPIMVRRALVEQAEARLNPGPISAI